MAGPKILPPSQTQAAVLPSWLSSRLPEGAPADLMGPMEVPGTAAGPLAQALSVLAPILGQLTIKGIGKAGELVQPLAASLRPAGKHIYEVIPPVLKRMEAGLKAGEGRPANWTRGERIVEAIGPVGPHSAEDMARKYNRGWGATSPNTDFIRNTKESLHALSMFLRGEPFTTEGLRRRGVTQVGTKRANLDRAYIHDTPLQAWSDPPGPGKTEAMAGFMTGEDRIPIDVHTLELMGADEKTFSEMLSELRALMTAHEGLPARGGLTNSQIYDRSEDAIRRGIQRITGTAYRPREDFAQMWEGTRGLKGLPYYRGVIDWLGDQSLLEPGRMGNPDQIDAILASLAQARQQKAAEEAARAAMRRAK